MNTAEIIAATLATKGIPSGSTVTVEPTDPIKMPNVAKFQAASIYVIGPRRSAFLGFVRHDGTIGQFARI